MANQLTQDCVIEATKQQISANLAGEVVVLNNRDGIYYSLNPVCARVWDLIKEPRSIRDIRDILLAEYDTDLQTCEADLMALIQDMARVGLVEIRDGESA